MANEETVGIEIRDANAESVRVTPEAPASVRDSKGVMGTATKSDGGTLTGEPTENDIVTVRGMEMTLETAEKHGFLTKGEDGRYRDVESTGSRSDHATDHPDKAEGETEDTPMLQVEPEIGKAANEISEQMLEQGINPVEVIGQMLTNPEATPEAVGRLAEWSGRDPADVEGQFNEVAAGIDGAIADFCVEHGGVGREHIESGEFARYLTQEVPSEKLVAAITQAVFVGDASPFVEIGKMFVSSHGSGRGDATKVERRTVDNKSVETVVIPGTNIRTSLEAARELGVV